MYKYSENNKFLKLFIYKIRKHMDTNMIIDTKILHYRLNDFYLIKENYIYNKLAK